MSTPPDPPEGRETLQSRAAGQVGQVGHVAEELSVTLSNIPQAAVGRFNLGRIVAGLGVVAGAAAALAPVIANMDITSTAGLIGGVGALAAVVYKWLDGWQKYEQDVRDPGKFNEPAP